ncbi:MAG TPA: DUF1318 domain-containing protein, partial [Verrucomicrobiae bacterium]|nr:DUF1318 domain-containing protein [Verrucomicrobiae bacterium]
MRQRLLKWLLAATCALTASCAVITVNVYFPEKDVKEAYKSLDDMLLKHDKDAPKPPQSEGKESSVFRFSLVSEAAAAEPQADELAVELASMPEVSKAYEEMKGRVHQLDELRASGVVGEGNNGALVVR